MEAAYIYDALGYLCNHRMFFMIPFTGKERDSESGNDYFGARYYAASMGRFMSPDPMGFWLLMGLIHKAGTSIATL